MSAVKKLSQTKFNLFFKSNILPALPYIASIFLFCIDIYLKRIARGAPSARYLYKNLIGWEYYQNTGIAFSIPFPQMFALIATPVILAVIFFFSKHKTPIFIIALGALSNFIDRLFFDATTDYIRIFTGVFNISDFLIAIGVLLLVLP